MPSWPELLAGQSLSHLPADFVAPSPPKNVESVVTTEHALQPDRLLAAFYLLVSKLTGDVDISVGTNDSEGRYYVLRVPIKQETSFDELVEQMRTIRKDVEPLAATFKAQGPACHVRFMTDQAAALQGSSDLDIDMTLFCTHTQLKASYNSLLFSSHRINILLAQIKLLASTTSQDPVGQLGIIDQDQAAILPYPSKDLHWNQFRGPISSIFSENAAKHPERPCVVVSQSQGADLVYTYDQIHKRSNALAQHFIACGIKKGDIVVLYAYRGVDLVVGVMGILKAGATFSVIDPAYPVERQCIYLSVARPVGLVVLEKAGTLSDHVRNWANDNLQLKVDVSDFAISDDGNTLRGIPSDVSTDNTNVEIGPDDIPTLSFTSGSEGVPKGVRGRHFSLTYYFPWMAQHFGLSESDRFTMLSGIAHDPIQRDIFAPLFLGASLIVPTGDDIGTPGRLAEWCALKEVTVTHLTPAMGQLLSSQVAAGVQIPTLRNAFFVGDVLTKRDVKRLQGLARSVDIINMYGTTETQRAVSFYRIPSFDKDPRFLASCKDIMPAGQGMQDVQLLVVSRDGSRQLCGVGQVGEIYVRAAGLAEGYLGLDDLTGTKFVTNWFVKDDTWSSLQYTGAGQWKGARDRLYRSGDLGRYLPDGNVECSGRADDQVKIRGFRIELGEIDTHLSRHPLVRENVTLLRRNKDEEPTLVSYFAIIEATAKVLSAMPADRLVERMQRFQPLVKDIREYLKGKLASYAVPTVYVPMEKMPLNPNGKVDKPALPYPDTAQQQAVSQKPTGEMDATQQTLHDIWREILPHAPGNIALNDNFFDLGGHSILATRLIFKLRPEFVLDNVPLGLIFKEPTIGGLAKEIERLRAGDASMSRDGEPSASEPAYAEDAKSLMQSHLASSYTKREVFGDDEKLVVFVTGGTGFLGAFLIRDLLKRSNTKQVIVHVRAKDEASGLARLVANLQGHGCFDEADRSRLSVVIGDLAQDRLGLSDAAWTTVCEEADAVIHNGAVVHWVFPYPQMRAANVMGTLSAIALCSEGKAKTFTFVSSTSVLDTEYFVRESDRLVAQGEDGILETDDLSGSATGLGTGYGQSKWVGEALTREAGRRGLSGCVVRPGYIVGDTHTGVTNTDDFLIRLVKGCIQVGSFPNIHNPVNMVPVDHVARVVAACALNPPTDALTVAHVTGHPRSRFADFLGLLDTFGFAVTQSDYIPWKSALETHVEGSKENALYPLLHFVTEDLPSSTKAPEMDDRHAREALVRDKRYTGVDVSAGRGVQEAEMGVMLAFLVQIGFLDAPTVEGRKSLPALVVPEPVLSKFASAGGRGSAH
ncbi:L-aminoadipate-semialdehyde dehydrogenase [Protomyces lactucae-debilis]|uniref:Alpha-aminoadipate reductase n=1 Tax=Protomyces lactucae-debilis TaxID=2754530 RepID=A0A1Y2F931_PROLT|nr:L-aminoadipate-semialdehyde dehydrogenase [Protomyces lactucae-debilis]ORY80373.1 L-aminoadipate-semialdehyde dehydrogenase [Protomyces lactucae-debilis]